MANIWKRTLPTDFDLFFKNLVQEVAWLNDLFPYKYFLDRPEKRILFLFRPEVEKPTPIYVMAKMYTPGQIEVFVNEQNESAKRYTIMPERHELPEKFSDEHAEQIFKLVTDWIDRRWPQSKEA